MSKRIGVVIHKCLIFEEDKDHLMFVMDQQTGIDLVSNILQALATNGSVTAQRLVRELKRSEPITQPSMN